MVFLSEIAGHVHPGMFIKSVPESRLNEMCLLLFKKKLNEKFPFVFDSLKAQMRASYPLESENRITCLVCQELQKKPDIGSLGDQVQVEVKQQNIRFFDGDIDAARCEDRVNYEKAIQALDKYMEKVDLLKMTEQEVHDCLKAFNFSLFPSLQSNKIMKFGSYRDGNIIITKIDEVDVFKNLGPYLEKNDPASFIGYQKWLATMQKISCEPIISPNVSTMCFSKEESAFVDKYIFIFPAPSQVPHLMEEFVRELISKIAAHEDPIHIAAFVHMRLVQIHPFADGNGRIARTFMNFILAKLGLNPLIFPSNKAYTRAIREDDQHVGAFEAFLRRRYEPFQRTSPEEFEFAYAMNGFSPDQIDQMFQNARSLIALANM